MKKPFHFWKVFCHNDFEGVVLIIWHRKKYPHKESHVLLNSPSKPKNYRNDEIRNYKIGNVDGSSVIITIKAEHMNRTPSNGNMKVFRILWTLGTYF